MRKLHTILALLIAIFCSSYVSAAITPGAVKTSFNDGDEVILYSASADEYIAGVTKTAMTREENVFILVKAATQLNGNPTFMLKQKSTGRFIQYISSRLSMGTTTPTPFQLIPATTELCEQWWPQDGAAIVGLEDVTLIAIDRPDGDPPYRFFSGHWKGEPCNLWSYMDTNAWVIYEIKNDPRKAIQIILDLYATDSFAPGSRPGSYPEALVTQFITAYQNAEALCNNSGSSEEELNEAYQRLEEALEAVKRGVNVFEGCFRIINALDEFYTQQGEEKAMYDDGEKIMWKALDLTQSNQAFRITSVGGELYKVQNLLTDLYISRYNDDNSKTLTEERPTYEIGIEEVFPEGGINDGEPRFKLTIEKKSIHAASHRSGAGISGEIVGWNDEFNSSSSWYIRPISQEELDILLDVAGQEALNKKLQKLVEKGMARYNAAIQSTNAEAGLVWDVAQLSSNADHNTTSGGEDGGGLPALLDGDPTTYFHSSWSNGPSEHHYLQVDVTASPVQFFSIAYTHRYLRNTVNRPTNIRISASNDGENWVTKWAIPSGIPTAPTDTFYVSPAIDLGESYNHIRLTVLETNDMGLHNGYPFFSLTEFQLYQSTINEDAIIAGFTEEGRILKEAILKAMGIKKATEADIETLEVAYNQFVTKVPYPEELKELIAEAKMKVGIAIIGSDPGQYPEEAVDGLTTAIENAEAVIASRPNKENLNVALIALNEAIEGFDTAYKSTIDTNKWYYIKGSSQAKDYLQGQYMYKEMEGNDSIYFDELIEMDPRFAWRFIQLDETHYAIQNLGSGDFIAATSSHKAITHAAIPGKYKVTALGGDAFNMNEENKSPLHGASDGVVVYWDGGIGSASIWTFESTEFEADEEVVGRIADATPNQYTAMCLPIGIDYIGDGVAYSVAGMEKDQTDNITSILLKEFDNGIVPAGTPFILKAESDEVVFSWGAEGTTDAQTINGLVGTFTSSVLREGLAYISGEKVSVSDGAYILPAYSAYIDVRLVTNYPDSDDMLDVEGVLTHIKSSELSDTSNVVNVYTATGIKVRHSVNRAEATSNLPKGVYIVGREKVIVK